MSHFIIRRLLGLLPVLVVISMLVFLMIHLTPGDPIAIMLRANNELNVGTERINELREALGLNDPMYVQYGRFIWRALHGDLGTSLFTGQNVAATVLQKLPITIVLSALAMSLAVLIGIPVGVISATRQYSFVDHATMVGALIGVSIPSFWLGLMLMILFALRLNVLPATGMATLSTGVWNAVKYAILPAITLGTGLAATITRLTRSSMLEVITQDYITTARAKGVHERMVVYKHALKNALLPVVTILGVQFGTLLGGSVITETIFAWPGVGRLAITAIQRRDYPMIQGDVLIISTLFILVNLTVDVLYCLINPRIRYN